MNNRRTVLAATPVLLVVVLAIAVACRPNQTLEGQTKDAGIKAQVKAKLASDVGAATVTAIEVNVTNGVVTLAGPVHSGEEKQKAETVARGVDGVRGVNNALQVMPIESAPVTPQPTPTMPAI